MSGSKLWRIGISLWICWFLLFRGADSQVTHPDEVKALRAVKKSLVDPNGNLSNWRRGDPCMSNWTGILCYNETNNDGYLHVRELGGAPQRDSEGATVLEDMSGELSRDLIQKVTTYRILILLFERMSLQFEINVNEISYYCYEFAVLEKHSREEIVLVRGTANIYDIDVNGPNKSLNPDKTIAYGVAV
ncbi:hypothetical protein FXO37_12744 [Capsicum annuum]|nr:hypothetical protein FXO37_12744 [Capsicum annuum]